MEVRPTIAVPARRLWLGLHLITLAFSLVVLLIVNRHQWFIGDDWTFIAQRRAGDVLTPHNGHWVALPLLVFRALVDLFGIGSYTPFVVTLGLAHVVATHLLWRVMCRSGVSNPVATSLAGIFGVLGAGHENLLWAFQITFIGAFGFGLGFLLLTDHPGSLNRRDFFGWAAGLASLMCSGVALTMCGVVTLHILIRRGWRVAAGVVGPPALVYSLWVGGWGWKGSASDVELSLTTVLRFPHYLWTGLSTALEMTSGVNGGGASLAVGLLIWVLWVPTRFEIFSGKSRIALPLSCAAGVVLLLVSTATVRLGSLGQDQSQASRYIYVSAGLLLPLIGHLLSGIEPDRIGGRVVLPVLGVFVLLHNLDLLRLEANRSRVREQASRRFVEAAAGFLIDHEPMLDNGPKHSPDPINASPLSMPALRNLLRSGDLVVRGPHARPDVLAAMSQFQVSFTPTPVLAYDAQPVPRLTVPVGSLPTPSCISLGGLASSHDWTLDFEAPASVRLMSSREAHISVLLQDRSGIFGRYADSERTPWVRSTFLAADGVVFLNVAAYPMRVRISVNADEEASLCGIGTAG
jgi:hypothetical protein